MLSLGEYRQQPDLAPRQPVEIDHPVTAPCAAAGSPPSQLANAARSGLRRAPNGGDLAQYSDPFYADDEYAGFSGGDPPSDCMSVADYEDAIERWARDRYPDLHDSEIAAFVAEWSIDQGRYPNSVDSEITELVPEETDSEPDDPDSLGWH